MNGRLFAERLAVAGLDPLELPAKAHLYERVLAAFRDLAGGPPQYAAWVPGRLEVFGSHTDYAGGRALVSALPRGFAFVGTPRDDRHLRVLDAANDQSMRIDTGGPGDTTTGWRHYVEVVVQRLARNFPGASLGADVVFASDLPRAAGMSSSSALMVGVATLLVRLAGIRERVEWRQNITDALDEAGYYACIENGRTFAGLTGEVGVGTHGGSEDHAAMVCGAAGTLSAFAFLPMRRTDTVRWPDEWRVLVISSGVAAEKTGPALESYNRLARGAAILLDLWNRSERPVDSLASALASDPSATRRLRELAREARVESWSADALDNRLQHFVREDARVRDAVDAFRRVDAAAVATLAAASQSDAEVLLRNQVGATMALTRMALDCDAIASRSFGAGFGGSVWAIAARDTAAAVLQEWIEMYRAQYSAAHAVAFVAQPSPSVAELLAGA